MTKDEIQRKEEDDFEHYFNGCLRLGKRVEELEAAIHMLVQGIDDVGQCWCLYVQLIHPPDDPQDSVKLDETGHTAECTYVRKIMKVKV